MFTLPDEGEQIPVFPGIEVFSRTFIRGHGSRVEQIIFVRPPHVVLQKAWETWGVPHHLVRVAFSADDGTTFISYLEPSRWRIHTWMPYTEELCTAFDRWARLGAQELPERGVVVGKSTDPTLPILG